MTLTFGLFIVLIWKIIAAIRVVIAVALAMVLILDQPMNILAHSPVHTAEAGIERHADMHSAKSAHKHSHDDFDARNAVSGPDRHERHLGHSAVDHTHEAGILTFFHPPSPVRLTQRTVIGSVWVKLPERLWPPERPPRHS